MGVQSISSITNRAISAIEQVNREVEHVAAQVAWGLEDHPGESASQSIAAVTRVPELKQRAQANAHVLDTAEQLLNELHNHPRR